jgi:hypothetical protein
MNVYEIKNLKTGWSREWGPGGSYQGTLYRGSKRVANVMEEGNGGCLLYEWFDRDGGYVEITVHDTNFDGKLEDAPAKTFKGTKEEKIFHEHADGLTYEDNGWDDKGPMVTRRGYGDYLITVLVGKFESERWLKRNTKKKTLFRLKGDKDETYRTVNSPYSARVKAWIESKYGDEVGEIMNERFVTAPTAAPVVKKPARKKKSGGVRATGRKLSVVDAAYEVLASEGVPLGYVEITEKAIEAGIYKTTASNPSNSLRDALAKAIKKGDERFERVTAGTFKVVE